LEQKDHHASRSVGVRQRPGHAEALGQGAEALTELGRRKVERVGFDLDPHEEAAELRLGVLAGLG